jgi:hypothetical protein
VQTPELYDDQPGSSGGWPRRSGTRPPAEGIWGAGHRVAGISALVLSLSTFMDWYTGPGGGVSLSVIGWHTGVLAKLVFFIGLAVLVIEGLRELGIELPPSAPESLVVLALGAVATTFVILALISIPDSVLPADSRGLGLWVSLLAALGVIAGGLLLAAEEL